MHVIVISFKSYDLSLKCGSHGWTCDDFTLQRIDDQMFPGEQINNPIYFALDQSFDLPATVMIETVNADPWIELSTFWMYHGGVVMKIWKTLIPSQKLLFTLFIQRISYPILF